MEKPYNCIDIDEINGNEVVQYTDSGNVYAGQWSRKFFADGKKYPIGYYTENDSLNVLSINKQDLFDTTVLYGLSDYGITSQLHNVALYASLNDISMCYLIGNGDYAKDIVCSLPSTVIESVKIMELTSDDDMLSFISDVIMYLEQNQFVFIEIDTMLDQRNMRSRSRRLFNRIVDVLYHQRISSNDVEPLVMVVDPLDFFLDTYTDLQEIINDLSRVNVGRIFHVDSPQKRMNKYTNTLFSAKTSIAYNVGSPGNAHYLTENQLFNDANTLLELDNFDCVIQKRQTEHMVTGFAPFPPTRTIEEVNKLYC